MMKIETYHALDSIADVTMHIWNKDKRYRITIFRKVSDDANPEKSETFDREIWARTDSNLHAAIVDLIEGKFVGQPYDQIAVQES